MNEEDNLVEFREIDDEEKQQYLTGKSESLNTENELSNEEEQPTEETNTEPITVPEEEPTPKPKSSGFIYGGNPWEFYSMDGQFGERMSGMGQGVIDFFTSDLPNLIPGVNIPKRDKFNDPVAQGIREISSFVGPMLMLGGYGGAALKGLAASGKGGPVINWLAKYNTTRKLATGGLALGTDLFVEGTNSLSQEGLNLTGVLKDTWPQTYTFIPDTIATNPNDGADIKRNKAVLEAGLSFLTFGALEGGIKLVNAQRQLKKIGNEIIPLTPESSNYFKNLQPDELDSVKLSDNPITDSIEKQAIRQQTAIEELAEYLVASEEILDQPIRGIHNTFDVEDMAVRTPEPDGVTGAILRQISIENNLGTSNGRLGGIVSEAFLKKGLEPNGLNRRLLAESIAEHIRASGKYDALINGKLIKSSEIKASGDALAQILVDPASDVNMIKSVLNEFKDTLNSIGVKRLDIVGYDATFKAIRDYMKLYFDMDTNKAAAYLATSLAGDVSDLAEGARLISNMSSADQIARAREMINDRLEYLMVEKALASWSYGYGLQGLKVWQREALEANLKARKAGKVLDYNQLNDVTEEMVATHESALANIITDTKNKLAQFRKLTEDNPEFFNTLYAAYEFSDGNIDTIHKLNNFVQNKLGVFSKLVYDGSPEMPSALNRAAWGLLFNSALSGTASTLRAFIGNTTGTIAKPLSMLTGALTSGDLIRFRRGLLAYSSVAETMLQANKHLGMVYRKAATDPYSINYVIRKDIAFQQEAAFDVLRDYATAAAKKGNYGPEYLVNMLEIHEGISMNPWLRYGANNMTALDGWTRAINGNWQARFQALDNIPVRKGEAIKNNDIDAAAKQLYHSFVDENGMITDSAVEYMSREIALNLDGPVSDALNTVLARIPAARTAIMFPKTQANYLSVMGKWSGPGDIFFGEFKNIVAPKLKYFEQNPERLWEVLTKRGFNVQQMTPTQQWEQFLRIRYEIKGRALIASSLATSAVIMVTQDRLRGNGHWRNPVEKTHLDANWKPRTYKGLDGKWYSYESLGPLADWLALVGDVAQVHTSIGYANYEELGHRLLWLLAENLTNKSFLAGLEPATAVLTGDTAAGTRWAASFANIAMPMGSLRNEFAKLMHPGLQEIEYNFIEMLANRSPISKGRLAKRINWLSGKQVGRTGNWMIDSYNALIPTFKYHGGDPTELEQFLIDIEYDGRPGMRTDGQGIDYTALEREEFQALLGKDEMFKREMNKIMFDAKQMNLIETLRDERKLGSSSKDYPLKKAGNIFRRLNTAIRNAMDRNERFLSNHNDIRQRRLDLRRKNARVIEGRRLDEIQRYATPSIE